jgi:acetoin utilization deacetylase AcuC-like enzyme
LRWLRRWRRQDRSLPIWYDAEYRLPLSALSTRWGAEPRRADLVAWYLVHGKWISTANLQSPVRARYQDIARVHRPEYLERLASAETLAQIFGVDPSDVPVDALMRTIRLAAGGTLEAARAALTRRGPAVNLLGGFHHAGPGWGSGLCPINDIAVAIAALRHEGLAGQVVVLDLDAHPPDGTAACLSSDVDVWIGSLSGGVSSAVQADETVLPAGCDDRTYLWTLERLLSRMPAPVLAVVLAGGDILAGDRFGTLGLSLPGARQRDLRVARALRGVPSVWLPGGGYHPRAWQVLAGTILALLRHSRRPIPPDEDPMRWRFESLARRLAIQRPDPSALTLEDVASDLGVGQTPPRLLNLSAEAVEYALYRFNILSFLERRGYQGFRVSLATATSGGERVSVFGQADGQEHLLVDCVLDRGRVAEATLLYIHWLALRDPKARFSPGRPRLPGQDVPGLGLVREMAELLRLMAEQHGLAGVAFKPAWYHTAYVARQQFRFHDAAVQGRFEAMLRDFAGLPLVDVSVAMSAGRVRLNDAPYTWEAEDMIWWREPPADDPTTIAAVRDRSFFTVQSSKTPDVPPEA